MSERITLAVIALVQALVDRLLPPSNLKQRVQELENWRASIEAVWPQITENQQ